MKIGDIVRVGRKHVALVIAVAHKGSEIRVRFLKEPRTRWVLVDSAEILNANR
jgi:hypothetical protein